jgi:FAD-dependent urate hydroxylase
MKVTIVGAGMGGLAVAALLSRTGQHEVTVLEQAARFHEAGYGIGLYPLGAMVYNAIGRGQQLRDKSVVLKSYEVHGPDGKLLQSIDLSGLLAAYGPLLGVTRTDMIAILNTAVPDGLVRFGSRAQSVNLVGDQVSVTLDNGETLQSDIVVAADGMHSAIRKSLFGEVAPYETGFDAWMWWAPLSLNKPDTVCEFWGPSAFVGLYPMREFINVAVAVPKELSPDPSGSAEDILQALRHSVEQHAPKVADTPHLWEIAAGKPFLWPMLDVRAPALTALDDRVALLGDAGVGFLPTAGVGASNALRSGAALAYELSLSDKDSAQAAVRRWSKRIDKIVHGNQNDSRQLAKLMMVKHASASALINLLMKYMPVTATTNSIIKSMEEPF